LYYPVAGLVNTVSNYGIQISEGNEIDALLNLSVKRKIELKRKGKEYALSCSWQNRATEWSKLIFKNNYLEKQLSPTEKRMFYLYESFSMPEAHTKMLKTISDSFTPKVIYDIGSNTLHWTKEVKNIWTNSEIFAFDAIQEAEELYKSKNVKYNIGVLSDVDNKIVKFYENKENPAGNSYYKEIGHPNSVNIFPENSYTERITMTLETVVKRNNFLLPDLVKIDVQGAELDILNGGMNIINNAKYLIIELQNVEYNRGAPLENITIDFLNKNGWEIVESKFSNNGPDADYLFINNNYKISDNNEESKDIWVFSPGTYMYTSVIQYIENLSDYKKKTIISNDINYINDVNPHKIIFLLNPSSSELFERSSLDKFINKNFAFLQLEPLTLHCHLNHIISYFNKYSYLKQYPIYDYSKTNIRILNENGFTNCIHLPYNCQPSELDFLIKSNTKNKEYDFGYIYDWIQVNNGVKSFPIKPPRRNKVTEFLINNGFTVNLIAGYGEDRDSELGKCKIILNIHGQINENPNPSQDECSNIFEHIRCDRLLKAGYTILSETSYDLDTEFINKYSNLKIINYKDFFNLDVINKILQNQPRKKIVDCFIFYNELDLLNYRLNILNDCVDYFVLVEATHTFVGKEKPLFYQENKEFFKEFNHKIIHIIVDDFSHKYPNINIEKGEQWNNEKFQRNCIKRGLDTLKLNDDDIFTVTDLDEIPDPNIFEKIKKNEINIDVVTIELDFYYYNLNCKINGQWPLSKMISYKKYKELDISCEEIRQNMSFEIIPNAGWHLSYFGNEQFIKNKIENFGHQELNIADFTDENKISNRIKNKLDVYDRPNNTMINIPIEDNNNLPPKYYLYLTKYYTNNIQNIKSNLIKYSNLRDDICHFENYDNYINWQTKLGLSFEKDNTEWMNGQRKCVEKNFNTIERNIKILDICCGDGQGLKKFKEMGFKNVYGVEVCKEKINFAKQYGYTIYECDICCGPFEIGDNYDCIYSSHTIEHVLNPEYTIRNIMSKLKDNGIFILILPYPDYGAANSLDEHRFKIHCGVIPLGLHINDKGYTICNTIRKMGYKITDCKFESYREPEIQLIITK
jgi:beta-1,4-mannosyl-glycoprotein beta-1,4-N-acetylglucosaminyltransferase